MSDDNIIHLEFISPHVDLDQTSILACKHCRNKTFLLTFDGEQFPMMKCAACSSHVGRMGWSHDDDEDLME